MDISEIRRIWKESFPEYELKILENDDGFEGEMCLSDQKTGKDMHLSFRYSDGKVCYILAVKGNTEMVSSDLVNGYNRNNPMVTCYLKKNGAFFRRVETVQDERELIELFDCFFGYVLSLDEKGFEKILEEVRCN